MKTERDTARKEVSDLKKRLTPFEQIILENSRKETSARTS